MLRSQACHDHLSECGVGTGKCGSLGTLTDKYGHLSVKINIILGRKKALRRQEARNDLGCGVGKGEGRVLRGALQTGLLQLSSSFVFLGFIFLEVSDTAQLHGVCNFSSPCE